MAINRQGSSRDEKATRAGAPPAISKRGPLPRAKPDQPHISAPDDPPPAGPAAPVKAEDPVESVRPEEPVAGAADGDRVPTSGDKVALAASQSDLAKLQAARRSRLIKAVALTAIALIFITFILQNAQPTDLDILAWTVSVQVIWVIVVSALLGAVAGYLVGRPDKKLLLHGPSRRDKDLR